ncbi:MULTISPECIES: tail assembly protein [unclassified Pseudomonas]|uniref:tail assembly protein n=1 Tax=unclassified Pseudomonas TaxID=196821 RepID=UPI000C18FD93|nr:MULTISPECIES: tail assembly protein [unclassified Pseudomonas]MBS3183763.1 tail assembly protein [Pseudomonas sp. PCH44]PIK77177.1 phage tail protein [Pseudomonas sp. 382]
MKRTVKLYGVLRKHFGREYLLDVQSPRDAVQALCIMLPGFEKFLATGEERGLVFTVFSGRRNLAPEELDLQGSDAEEIRIAPIIQGSKQGGLFQVVLGAVLVVAGVFTGGLSSGVGIALMAGGAALALGGVVQMLSPTAKTGSLDRNEDGNNPSYGFGSAVTTIAQGNPYPVLYGEREIGGAIESGGVYPQDKL